MCFYASCVGIWASQETSNGCRIWLTMRSGKKRTVLLGLVFLFFLILAYVENTSFFVYIRDSFTNLPLGVVLVFVHMSWRFRLSYWI